MIKRTLFFSNPAYLSMEHSQLAVRMTTIQQGNEGGKTDLEVLRTIPIEDIGIIVLENRQITITT